MSEPRACDIPRMKRKDLDQYALRLHQERDQRVVSARELLESRAGNEELVEERDAAVEAWEECCSTISELRAERDDAISEARRWREIARKNGYEA